MDESQNEHILGPEGVLSDALMQRCLSDLFNAMQAVIRADPDYRGKLAFALVLASDQKRAWVSSLPPDISHKFVAEAARGVAEAKGEDIAEVKPPTRQ